MLHIDANFPGGAVDMVRVEGDTLYFQAPLDASTRSLWFYFRISGGKGRRLTLVQEGLDKVLGVFESRGYAPVVPVVRDGGEWNRVDESLCRYQSNPLQFSFEIAPQTEECFVAFCFPYTLSDAGAFIDSLPGEIVRRYPIGYTKAGREQGALLIGREDKARDLALVTARQHAGEVSGSYVLEGFLSELLGGSPAMEELLETTLFLVVPVIDADCVEEGRYGKDQLPIDMGRDWGDRPYHPEVRNIMNEVARLTERFRLVWMCDLHAPQPGAASYLPPDRAWPQDSPEWNRMWNLALRYEEKCRARVCYNLADVDQDVLNWGGVNSVAGTGAYFKNRYNCLTTAFEYSYHRDGDMRVIGIPEWRFMGRMLIQAAAEMLANPAAMEVAPDKRRIPQWTMAPEIDNWHSVRKLAGLILSSEGGALRLTPENAVNSAWLGTSMRPCPAAPESVLRLYSREGCSLNVYTSFFREGLLSRHQRFETIVLSPGELFDYILPPPPGPQMQYSVYAVIRNLTGELLLTPLDPR